MSIAVLLLTLLVTYSCKNSNQQSGDTPSTQFEQHDFTIDFAGVYTYNGPDTLETPKCTDTLADWRVMVEAEGTSDFFGPITMFFDFCGNNRGFYGNCEAILVDSQNDSLFLTCSGRVIAGRTAEHPDHVNSYWKDDFIIQDGTGKYEMAFGEGKTNDFNSDLDTLSHHLWKGTISIARNQSTGENDQ